MNELSVLILGSGSAAPTSLMNPTAQLLQIAGRFFLIDCGEGTQQQLRRNKAKISKIERIFISHLHGDHYFGLVGLLSTYHLLNRQSPLYVYGPPKLEEIIDLQLEHRKGKLSYPLHFKSTQAGSIEKILDNKHCEVWCFPLDHRVATTGFLFKEKPKCYKINREAVDKLGVPVYALNRVKDGEDYVFEDGRVVKNEEMTFSPDPPKAYAFCSDTAFKPDLAPFLKGVDLLYHESTFLHQDHELAEITRHSTSLQAGSFAALAGVKKLILGHFSPRYEHVGLYIEEAKSVFENTVAAREGDWITP